MNHSLRILHLEDNPRDAELIRSAIEAEGLDCELRQVKNRLEFESAVASDQFDVILCDYQLPDYNGFAALTHVRQTQADTPVILLSGTLGEEQAVDSLKSGATDYVLKQRLTRLVPAIRRAVTEAKERAKREQAEEQVRTQATFLDKARDAIFVRDLQNRIHYWNKGAERVYGWTAEEAIGRDVNELLSQTTQARPDRNWTKEQGDWTGELQQRTKFGKEVLVQSRWTLMHGNGAKPDSVLVINTDITEKKQIEAQFLRTQRMETIGALAGGIAHDLNNMLAPILMAVDLLHASQSPEDKEVLEMVGISAQRGADMVRQILSFARGASGEHGVVNL
jgi:two-component system, cell cycle sensor histidine kinase and response regulator CckA